ncbi:TraM recognition domain-containing protein, partial [Candidatus Gribaldobacteria bacterium]|nr:TraM recognition domain-containing protein [Candidatus Gribaldobacteria bacterium]
GQTKSDMLGYVVSKVGRFVENEMMRNIIGQQRSSFDLGEIMDQKKIFLANLSKGQTGEMNSSLLGLILVSKMQIAAFRRANIEQEKRRDFYLYIDEFQNFTTDSIAIILSEARKYRLNLILAHQFMPQLTEQIRNAVIGNVGSIAAFRVGADDAEFLEKQFTPEFSKFDLLNLDNFNFILKMMLNNRVSRPFRAIALKPVPGNYYLGQQIKQFTKMKYGRAKQEVTQEIQNRAKLGSL